MKKAITCILLFFFATTIFSQQKNDDIKTTSTKKFYFQAGAGVATAGGFSYDFGILGVLKSDWTLSASYKKVEMKAKNLPDNYERGVTYVIFFPFYDEWPLNKMSVFNFTLGKYFETGKKTWITTEGGLSIVSGQTLTFTPQQVVSNLLFSTSNYSYQKENKTGFGAILKSDFNWAIFPFAGLGASVYADLNSLQSPLGLELKFILGNLRKHK
jgi:hypothetical protein